MDNNATAKNNIDDVTEIFSLHGNYYPYNAPEINLSKTSTNSEFWRVLKPFSQIDEAHFLSYKWQVKETVSGLQGIKNFLQSVASDDFIKQLLLGVQQAPMTIRLTPYILSRIDWSDPVGDPIRRQFIPLAAEYVRDHPMLNLDSLAEQNDSPVPGLVHRYPDKALFLAQSTCPVYCRFCTRSYLIGQDTDTVTKVKYQNSTKHWRHIFDYLETQSQIEDIVVSGGDCYHLSPQMLEFIGESLLPIPHIRRIRFATKGLAVEPTKILTDHAWTDTLTRIVDRGRKITKHVALHTHFNHPNEISWITQKAANRLFERGVTVRNQSVLIRGVNNNSETMVSLVKKLAGMNIQPYYVYQHDLVKGVENLRTDLYTNIWLEKWVRGITAGFYTPTFVTDCPGGGGKRVSSSYEYYNRQTGVSVYIAPSIKQNRAFLYFDPLPYLKEEVQKAWFNPKEAQQFCAEALSQVSGLATAWKDHYLEALD
ncbi:MAG: KamA family radical SAM protein [Prochloraceae cyanobacterium]|nr:KamA family radical SAM protein [Prochloraceae cyanobacterium]